MGKMIYVVTSGDYSDYGIDAIFDSKEMAEKMVELMPKCRVEEYELNSLADKVKQGMGMYSVYMLKDGTTEGVYRGDISGQPSTVFYGERADPMVYLEDQFKPKRPAGLFVDCFAKDEQHAVKIANEIRVQRIAENKWE